jgi:DNA-directed RNA polymerase specialized sigma24 family protein
MDSESTESVTAFFNQLRMGDSAGAELLWERFSPRLLRLARKTLGDRAHMGFDEDDVVQSAFVSFCQGAADGQFARDMNRDDLWNLLGRITVRKAQKKFRDSRRQKRGGGRVFSESALAGGDSERFDLDAQFGEMPVSDLDETCEELFSKLDEEPCRIVLLKLWGHTNRDISTILGCTERKVERKLQLIRRVWKELELGE